MGCGLMTRRSRYQTPEAPGSGDGKGQVPMAEMRWQAEAGGVMAVTPGPRGTAGEGRGPMGLGLAVHGEGKSPDLILRFWEVTGGFLTMP